MILARRQQRSFRCILSILVLAAIGGCGSGSSWDTKPDEHFVRRGETLYSIAWRYGEDPADVARWNQLGDGSLIHPGDVIRLTPPSGASTRSSTSTPRASQPLPSVPTQPPPPWTWPTKGDADVQFGGKPGTGTGILINGKEGQAINAAASGRVVYAGSGLIGYGQLIILKHNDTYLSAYGYNESLLVKEGETIKKGQRIATMGEGAGTQGATAF